MRGEQSQRLCGKRQMWGQSESDLVLAIQPGLQQLLGQHSDVTRTCEMPPGFFSLGMSRTQRQGVQGLNKEMQSREVMRHSEESFTPALNNL